MTGSGDKDGDDMGVVEVKAGTGELQARAGVGMLFNNIC